MKTYSLIRTALVLLTASPLSLGANSAHAAETPDFYRLQPLTVTEVPATPEELYSVSAVPAQPMPIPQLQTLELDWGTLVAIGEKVIQLVKAGAPVTNVTRDSVAVVPAGLSAWEQLSGWQTPVTKVYSVTAKNYLGMTVIDLRLKVSAMYGGGLDGRGHFLANVNVVPTSVYVLWGFTCNVWSEHRDPVNVGSKADPVAGLGFDIRYSYGSALNTLTGAQDYFVNGRGEIQQLQ